MPVDGDSRALQNVISKLNELQVNTFHKLASSVRSVSVLSFRLRLAVWNDLLFLRIFQLNFYENFTCTTCRYHVPWFDYTNMFWVHLRGFYCILLLKYWGSLIRKPLLTWIYVFFMRLPSVEVGVLWQADYPSALKGRLPNPYKHAS